MKNLNNKHALARTSYDFETVCNEGMVEKVIIFTALGEIILRHERVFVGFLKSIEEVLNKVNFDELRGQLSDEEINDLSSRIKNVLVSLGNMPIDLNPSAEE